MTILCLLINYNDINNDACIQLELIQAALQAKKKQADKPRNPIGFKK